MAETLGIDPSTVFLAIAALMFLGFIGNLIFAKLRFNDTLILIGVGALLGPILGLVDPTTVQSVSTLVGPLALILILFEGGLALRFKDLIHGLAGATSLALIGFVLTSAAVGAVTAAALDVDFNTGLILGAILGGTSALVVMPSLQHMKCEKRTATTLNLESALTDVLVVVVSFTLISLVAAGLSIDAGSASSRLAITFFMSLMAGTAAGFVWLLFVPAVAERQFGYMLTLGMMFFLYVAVEEWLLSAANASGGGPLAVLAFGVVVGNADAMGDRMRARIGKAFGPGLQRFQGEIAFLVRTFFFVYLGILVDPELLLDPFTLIIGTALFVVMLATRYLAVAITERTTRLEGDAMILWVMMPRGLAAAVLAGVPANEPYNIPGTESFVSLAFLILVYSNLWSTVGAFVIERKQAAEADPAKRAAKERRERARARSRAARSGKGGEGGKDGKGGKGGPGRSGATIDSAVIEAEFDRIVGGGAKSKTGGGDSGAPASKRGAKKVAPDRPRRTRATETKGADKGDKSDKRARDDEAK